MDDNDNANVLGWLGKERVFAPFEIRWFFLRIGVLVARCTQVSATNGWLADVSKFEFVMP